jgi:hypothetical protein
MRCAPTIYWVRPGALGALVAAAGVLAASAGAQEARPELLSSLTHRATRVNNLRFEVEWKEYRAPLDADSWDSTLWETRLYLDELSLTYLLRQPDWRLDVLGGDRGGKFIRDYAIAWFQGGRRDFARHPGPKRSVGSISAEERTDSGFLSGFPFLTPVELDLFEYGFSLAEGIQYFAGQPQGEALIDGERCLRVVNTAHTDNFHYTWYFDVSRDYLPRRIEFEHIFPSKRRIFWDYRCWSHRPVGQTHVADEAVMVLRNPSAKRQPLPAIFHWRATAIAPVQVTDQDFAVAFPPGTYVFDYVRQVKYEVRADGRPIELVKIEPKEQIRTGRALKAQLDSPEIRRKRQITFSMITAGAAAVGFVAAVALYLTRRRQAVSA